MREKAKLMAALERRGVPSGDPVDPVRRMEITPETTALMLLHAIVFDRDRILAALLEVGVTPQGD